MSVEGAIEERVLPRRAMAAARAAPLWLALLALTLFLPGFFGLQPMDRDEPRFAQATKQMLASGDFVDIRFQDAARDQKPVGIYWLQASVVGAAAKLGVPDALKTIWLYRIPSLIGAIGAVLLTYWCGRAFLSEGPAFLAGAALASTILLGVEARLATTDAMLCAATVAAMGALARIYLNRCETRAALWLAFIFWTAIGFGVLLKGPITPMIAAFAVLALSLKERSGKWLLALRPALGFAWALALAAPWLVLIIVRTHGAFLVDSVGRDMLAKVAHAKESHGAPPGSYLLAFWLTAWPMAPVAALAAPFIWRRRRESEVAFLIAWAAPSWLLFELVPTKLPHYVLPLYPAIALALALAWDRGALAFRKRWSRPVLLLVPAVAALFVAVGVGLAIWLRTAPGWPFWLSTPVILWMAWRMTRPEFEWNSRVAAAAVWALAFLVYFGVYGGVLSAPMAGPIRLSPRLAHALEAAQALAGPRCRQFAVATTKYREPSLVFLAGTKLRMLEARQAAAFLADGGCRAALVDKSDEEAFRSALPQSIGVRRVGRVSGLNLNGGHWLTIDVWLRGAQS